MTLQDPSGAAWRVKRRWLPWRLRKRDPEALIDGTPEVGTSAEDLLIGLVVFVAIIVLVVLLPFVAVLAVLVAEAFLLVLLLPLVVLLRASLVAKWPIEAWQDDRLVHAEAVRGWTASRHRMLELRDGIRLGELPRDGASPTA